MFKRLDPYVTPEVQQVVTETKDFNNCTVVTLHKVTGKPYRECHDFMHTLCRSKKRRVSDEDIALSLTGQNLTKLETLPYSTCSKISISKFIKLHPKGIYYCLSAGHAFAIIDGILYDHSDKPRRMIKHAVRVTR